MTLYVKGKYHRDGWGFSHELYEASPADILAGARNIKGVMEMGWCPRGEGHWDMPETPTDAGDHGVCGSKWTHRYLVVPLDTEEN